MGRFLEHIIAALAWTAVIAAGAWFGAPLIWRNIQAGEAAKVTVQAQTGALAADTAAATRAQASCSTEVAHAMDAAKAIATASKAQPVAAGQPRPMITADQIRGMIQ